jgi:hypothetical protein
MATRIETAYTRRARYYSSADGFNIKRPAVPAHVFTAERDRALDPAVPTGLIPLDLSGPLGLDLIVQDGGLHYHTRTMGFSYE